MSAFVVVALLAADWKYVAPAPGSPEESPPLRALDASAKKPDDVTEEVKYRGQRRSYAQLRFGTPASIRATIVLDEIDEKSADLYVDANRDRTIEKQEKLPGSGPIWRFALAARGGDGDGNATHPREVVVRRGRQRGRMSMATVGFLEGEIELGGAKFKSRRTDEDGNGRFGDPNDRFLIDFDGNGEYDPLAEQFPATAVWTRSGKRYAVSSDPWKGGLSFTVIEGEGVLTAAPLKLHGNAKTAAMHVGFAGRDGTPYSVGHGEKLSAPPGEVRVDTLSVTLDDEGGKPSWHYTFSYCGGKPQVWRPLRRSETLAVDPVGELSFFLESTKAAEGVRPGDDVSVNVRLFTGDGLLVNEIRRTGGDSYASAPTARVTLQTTDGRVLSEYHSGFA